MVRIVGAIVARDEASNLGPCLDSLAWTDPRVVLLDSRTIDQSRQVAESRGAVVVARAFESFPAQRNAVLELIRARDLGEWVIFLDADERAPGSLAAEVQKAINETAPDRPAGYWIPRRNFIWGGWIRHGGWSPDHQLRLLEVDRATYDVSRDVHELARLDGHAGYLREPMLHYNYDGLRQFLRKQHQYSRLEARRLAREERPPRPWAPLVQPYREARRRFVDLHGYRDGWRGLALALLLGYFTGIAYGRVVARLP